MVLTCCVLPGGLLWQVVGSTYQVLESPNPATYIGSGKVAEVAAAVQAAKVNRRPCRYVGRYPAAIVVATHCSSIRQYNCALGVCVGGVLVPASPGIAGVRQ
jgi:hypothetical protein